MNQQIRESISSPSSTSEWEGCLNQAAETGKLQEGELVTLISKDGKFAIHAFTKDLNESAHGELKVAMEQCKDVFDDFSNNLIYRIILNPYSMKGFINKSVYYFGGTIDLQWLYFDLFEIKDKEDKYNIKPIEICPTDFKNKFRELANVIWESNKKITYRSAKAIQIKQIKKNFKDIIIIAKDCLDKFRRKIPKQRRIFLKNDGIARLDQKEMEAMSNCYYKMSEAKKFQKLTDKMLDEYTGIYNIFGSSLTTKFNEAIKGQLNIQIEVPTTLKVADHSDSEGLSTNATSGREREHKHKENDKSPRNNDKSPRDKNITMDKPKQNTPDEVKVNDEQHKKVKKEKKDKGSSHSSHSNKDDSQKL